MAANDWIDVLFGALARQEGAFSPDPNTIPRRRNNPLDLRFAGQVGASAPAGMQNKNIAPPPIAQFDTLAHGIAAGYRQLWADIARGDSLRKLIYSWAPPNENDTAGYLANVARWVAVADLDAPLLELLTLPSAPPDAPPHET